MLSGTRSALLRTPGVDQLPGDVARYLTGSTPQPAQLNRFWGLAYVPLLLVRIPRRMPATYA